MSELKLISKHPGSIKSLVEGAIIAPLRSTEAGIKTTEQRLQEFEQKYQIPTEQFIQRYENDEFQETLEFIEWIGESRMLQGLREDAERLRGIEQEDKQYGQKTNASLRQNWRYCLHRYLPILPCPRIRRTRQ
jgi:hypothetical protein